MRGPCATLRCPKRWRKSGAAQGWATLNTEGLTWFNRRELSIYRDSTIEHEVSTLRSAFRLLSPTSKDETMCIKDSNFTLS